MSYHASPFTSTIILKPKALENPSRFYSQGIFDIRTHGIPCTPIFVVEKFGKATRSMDTQEIL